MIFLLDFLPFYCPACGTPTGFDDETHPDIVRFSQSHALTCSICQTIYQKIAKVDLLRAATASGGDLIEYFIEDDAELPRTKNGKH